MYPKTIAAVLAACALAGVPAIALAQPSVTPPVRALGTGALADSAPVLARHALVRRTLGLAAEHARLSGTRLTRADRARIRRLTLPSHVRAERRLSRQVRTLRAQTRIAAGVKGTLAKIAACESGGNYATNTGNGFYGAYQFDQGTWASVGGHGLPSDASPAEQDMRAALLLARSGSSPWPVCGR